MTLPEAFAIAVQHHQSGRFAQAEAIYREVLAVAPESADALHLLGVLTHQSGRSEAAIGMIQEAIALMPAASAFHSNLGEIYRKLGRADEAMDAYRQALQIDPENALAHNNLGNVLRDRGRLDEALAEFRRAIQLKPDYPDAYCNLGNVLRDMGGLDEAMAACQRALQLRPDFPEAHNNLGNVLRDRGQADEAIVAYHHALRLHPDSAEVCNNLGAAFQDRFRFDEAIAAYRRAIQLQADHVLAHNNLGVALGQQGRLDEAVAACRRAIELKPDYAEAHNNLGIVLKDQGWLGEAIAAIRRALELKPDFPAGRSNLLLDLHYLPEVDLELMLREHARWEELHARPSAGFVGAHSNVGDRERRLRIGYVSPDFWEHPVATFLEGLLMAHDRSQVEVFCYADGLHEDRVTERFMQHAGQWRRITGLKDEQVAELIRRDGIDILVDLAGHTAGNRLLAFACKPAPVQVSWLGYPDTTGLKAMNYRLTDAHADPPGTTERWHTERLVRLPESAWCYRPVGDAPPVSAAPCVRTGGVTFGCFNAQQKINGPLLALWAGILRRVPGSRLLLKNRSLGNASVQARMRALLEEAGIAPERVELAGPIPGSAGHLAAYGRVDIALDTFPYHGTTTTCEALWMGVPVVTLAGKTHVSRVGVSLLSNVGLPECIARSAEEYAEIAVRLAGDVVRLAELRATLRERMQASPLMDAPRFARNIEQAYRQMWRAWCAQQCSVPKS